MAQPAFLVLSILILGLTALQAQTNAVLLGAYQAHPTKILVKFKAESKLANQATILRQAGSRVQRGFSGQPRLAVLEDDSIPAGGLPASEPARRARLLQRIEALQQTGLFEVVEPNYYVFPTRTSTDTAFVDGRLWGLRNFGQFGGTPGADISATNAWDITVGSTNVIVAVIDTGVRYTHQALTNQMWRNPREIPGNGIDDDTNGIVDDVFGIDATTTPPNGNPMDLEEHGTHVSGTIGASANDANPHVGVAWNVRIMALKFLGPFGGTTADAITCVDYAVANGARILNNSWGGGGYSQLLFEAIERARQAGVLFVAAAGNNGRNSDLYTFYPASYSLDNIISVAALDRNDQLADFSNFGFTSVDVGAPGVEIFSSVSTSDFSYDYFQGTSMAAPHVSGVAALILAAYPGVGLDELQKRLLLGAVPIQALSGRCSTSGRINAYNSLTLTGSGVLQQRVVPPTGSALVTGTTQTIRVTVTDPPFSVVNATVRATIPGVVTNLAFLNNGQGVDAVASDNIYSVSIQVPAATNTLAMTVIATATNKFSATNTIYYAVIAPPANNNFTNATKVSVGGAGYLANNRAATLETALGEPTHAGVPSAAASLWWNWTPASDTDVLVDTIGSAIDTIVAVYTGPSLIGLTQVVATNDVGTNRQAYVRFNATAGATYHIAVASVDSSSVGSLRLAVVPGGRPDTNAPTVQITNLLSGIWVSNRIIAVSGIASDPPPSPSQVDRVLVDVNGRWQFTAEGTNNWSCLIGLSPGLNRIKVNSRDVAGNVSATALLQVNYFQPGAVNDMFASAIALAGNSGLVSGATTNASKEFGEPYHAANAGGRSLWWSFLPPADGVLTIRTTNNTFDTVLGLYTGASVSGLTPLAGNDDAYQGAPGGFSLISQAVRNGQTSYIALDGYSGASGTSGLSYLFVPASVHRLTTGSGVGGSVQATATNSLGGTQVMPGAAGDFADGTTVTLTATPALDYQFETWGGSTVSTSNPLSVLIQDDATITASFVPTAFTEPFESGDLLHLTWVSPAPTPWFVQSGIVAAGQFAARSGAASHSQRSSLILTTNFNAGPASFNFSVSSETDFDFLDFYVDGVLLQRWSGEIMDWGTYTFPLTAGIHVLEWRYSKDASVSSGLDAAFIDNVNLPIAATDEGAPAVGLQMARGTDGSSAINLLGQAGQLYILQASGDLVDWINISTNFAVNGFIQIPDPSSSSNAVRFYRAVAAP